MPPSLCASNGCAHPLFPSLSRGPSQTCSRTAFRFVSLINVEPSLSLIASNVNCAKRLANLRRLVGRRASPRVVNVSFRIYIYIYIFAPRFIPDLFLYTIFPDYLTRSVSNQFHPTISEHYARTDYTASSPLMGIIVVRKTRFHSLNSRRDACFDRSNFRRYFFAFIYNIRSRIIDRFSS